MTQSAEPERVRRIDAPLAQIPAAPFDAGRSRVDLATLSGGLRVLTSEDRSVPLVTIGVYLAGGVRYENDKNNGVTTMLRELLLSSADSKAAGAQYRHSLADVGRLVPYQDRDMWGVSLSVPADSWRDALGRLGAMFAHPEIDTVSVDATRLLVLNAAHRMDTVGNKAAAREIAMIKVAAPTMACKVIDWAIQAHGGGGLSDDFALAYAYAHARTLRFADGPDEVHRNQIGRMELSKYR